MKIYLQKWDTRQFCCAPSVKLNCFFAVVAATFISWPTTAVAATPTQQAYVKASNIGANDSFGYAAAISGDTMVVGAPSEDSNATGVNGNQNDDSAANSGAAYIFVRSGSNWIQQAYLKASNTGADDRFGYRVAISGDTVVVGAHQEDSNAPGVNGDGGDNSAGDSGAAYIFVRNGTNWTQQAYLKASNTGANDLFGRSVAISGDTIVIGANWEDSNAVGVKGDQNNNNADNAGAAYIFVRSGTNWSQQAYLKSSTTDADDQFGFRVSVSGDTVVVSAWEEDSNAVGVNGDQNDNSAANSGAAYIFVRDGTNWTQQAYLKASNTGAGDHFGVAIAISDDTIVAGSYQEDSSATGVNGSGSDNSGGDSGAAYVFLRNGTNWSQQAYLKASNTGANDWFAFSVAVWGDTVMIGAPQESSYASGVNSNQADNSAASAGAAYIFVRSGTNWSQQAYLKAFNTWTGNHFGWTVALFGDSAVVGAPLEDSRAIGLNIAYESGAAYVFTGFGIAPRLAIAPDGSGGYFIRGNGMTGSAYQWQRAPNVNGPWTSNATTIALAPGVIELHDTNAPPGQAFYRVVQQ